MLLLYFLHKQSVNYSLSWASLKRSLLKTAPILSHYTGKINVAKTGAIRVKVTWDQSLIDINNECFIAFFLSYFLKLVRIVDMLHFWQGSRLISLKRKGKIDKTLGSLCQTVLFIKPWCEAWVKENTLSIYNLSQVCRSRHSSCSSSTPICFSYEVDKMM